MPTLITQEQRALLLANGAEFDRNEDFDPPPVVKLFMPDGGATWLLASLASPLDCATWASASPRWARCG